jgi:hypothetical protein
VVLALSSFAAVVAGREQAAAVSIALDTAAAIQIFFTKPPLFIVIQLLTPSA